MHRHRRAGLGTRLEERVPVPGVDRRQAEVVRQLTEADGRNPSSSVAPDLLDGGRHIPQRDQAERHESTVRVAAPLLDHPVVVGLDAREAELLVAPFRERLSAEPRERREAHRRLHPAPVHVLETGLRVEATGPHVVVGHRRERVLLRRVPGRRDVSLQRELQVLVDPAVDLRRRIVVEDLLVVARIDHVDPLDAATHHLRAAVAVLGGQPPLPDVRRFDDVVIDADDLGQIHPSSSLYVLSRPRRPMRSTVSAHLCPRDFVPGCSATPAVRMAKERSMTSSAW